jgi:hypothetical protein
MLGNRPMKSVRALVQPLEVFTMKKAILLTLGILLVASGIVWAQPPGCTWEGDPSFRFGWGAL